MTTARFTYPLDTLRQIALDLLRQAAAQGASACEAEVSEGYGQTAVVRKGEVETIEYNRDKSIGVTAYLGQRKGFASTSDFSPKALTDTVAAAVSIARFTASDDCAGLAEPELMARDIRDLDLFHPWDLPVDEAIERARACEAAAFALDPRIVNSEGAGVSTQQHQFVLANSNGFAAGYPTTRHYLSCAVIAEQDGAMQRDDWYAEARDARDLPAGEALGRYAGERALARLKQPQAEDDESAGAVRGADGERPAREFRRRGERRQPVSQDLVSARQPGPTGVFAAGADHRATAPEKRAGERLLRRRRRRHACARGGERRRAAGLFPRQLLGAQTRHEEHRQCRRQSQPDTSKSGELDLPGLLKKMGRGLLVTDLMGQGINMVTGDYSRGAAGYWVEGGVIRYPVEEITIAGNLRDMFKGIAAVGRDELTRGSRRCGSILIDSMTIAGN